MKKMGRFPSLFLVIAIMLMTPVGVYTCGSLANSLVFMRGDDMLPFPSEDPGTASWQLTQTAVTSYLSSPLSTMIITAVLNITFLVFATTMIIFPPQIYKRKPPTPPPTLRKTTIHK